MAPRTLLLAAALAAAAHCTLATGLQETEQAMLYYIKTAFIHPSVFASCP
jgi:hypothetical protein